MTHLAGCFLVAAACLPRLPAVRAAQFASGVDLVEVYATVTDRRGEPVTGLAAADFQVSEDDRPQRITTFGAGDFPLAVAIGIDRSFSMRAHLSAARSAARLFIEALRGDDQVMVVAIGSETAVLAPLSMNHGAAADAVDRLDVWGTTALYDATLAAIDAVQPAKGRRALVLLSDGIDRYSRTTAAMLVVEAHRRDVLIYPIAIGGGTRPPVFAELAAATGGRSFLVKDPRDLPSTLGIIARELRFQYLLGYSSSERPVGEPQWRSIQVAVNRPGVRVRARTGYLAK